MSEIEKMYENAGIKKVRQTNIAGGDYPIAVGFEDYPPFTAKKQLELIKWLSQHTYRNYIKFRFDICGLWYCECNMSNSDMHHTFEEALAGTTNSLWQDLTEEEKQQVKGILE